MEEKNNIPEVIKIKKDNLTVEKIEKNYFAEYKRLKDCSVMKEIMKIEKDDFTIKDRVMIYKWKGLLENLGVFPELESWACGAVNIRTGSVIIGTTDTVDDHEDAPQINFLFKLNNKVNIWFVDISDSGSYDSWLKDLVKVSPISATNPAMGITVSWEEAYNLLEKYIEFREKNIFPQFPEDY